MRVLNFGSLNIDYTYRVDEFVRPGETKSSLRLEVNCGGKGLNQSVALARAGVETWHAGLIGPEGQFLSAKLKSCGVETRFVRCIQSSTGHAMIQVNARGENCILLYPGTNEMLTGDFVDEVLGQFGAGDLVLLQNETNLVGEIMEKAARRGMQVAFNAAPMNGRVADYPLDKVNWLFVNETEGAAMSGETEETAIAAALRRRWPGMNVVLTLGEAGSLYAGAEGVFRAPARPVTAVDTTAAGDTFTGFFLRAVLDGRTPQEALGLATAASAITVTRPGAADSIPSWAEVAR